MLLSKRCGPYWLDYTPGSETEASYTPRVDVVETPKSYEIRVLVPGIDPEKIELKATRKSLWLQADIPAPTRTEEETVHFNQLFHGRLEKKLVFGQPVEDDKIEARYEYGILHIHLPKAEAAEQKVISIKVTQ